MMTSVATVANGKLSSDTLKQPLLKTNSFLQMQPMPHIQPMPVPQPQQVPQFLLVQGANGYLMCQCIDNRNLPSGFTLYHLYYPQDLLDLSRLYQPGTIDPSCVYQAFAVGPKQVHPVLYPNVGAPAMMPQNPQQQLVFPAAPHGSQPVQHQNQIQYQQQPQIAPPPHMSMGAAPPALNPDQLLMQKWFQIITNHVVAQFRQDPNSDISRPIIERLFKIIANARVPENQITKDIMNSWIKQVLLSLRNESSFMYSLDSVIHQAMNFEMQQQHSQCSVEEKQALWNIINIDVITKNEIYNKLPEIFENALKSEQ